MPRRVALGMSGGVDSSVSARMLMDAGFDVVGVTCVFVDDEATRHAVADARAVADMLGIAHVVKDCTERFSCTVVDPFVEAYASGETPSPCVACNRSCKIPSLIEAADEQGCPFIATGHYAKVVRRDGRFAIARAAYLPKDQSYMLSLLSQDVLARLLLPLGSIAQGKAYIRDLAASWGLPVASKSDSQDICFIHGSHLDFLSERGLAGRRGAIVTLDGRVVGSHEGLHRYTMGQRKGLDIGGAPEPYYVVGKRFEENELVVAFVSEASIDGVCVKDALWQAVSPDVVAEACKADGSFPCSVKLRYRQNAAPCRIVHCDAADASAGATRVRIELEEPQATTAPGQYAVFYDDDVVLGGGVIESLTRNGRDIR